jgi:hypothetical protein
MTLHLYLTSITRLTQFSRIPLIGLLLPSTIQPQRPVGQLALHTIGHRLQAVKGNTTATGYLNPEDMHTPSPNTHILAQYFTTRTLEAITVMDILSPRHLPQSLAYLTLLVDFSNDVRHPRLN